MKASGIRLGDFPLDDVPHTISYAILYRLRINSFGELPKDKRPPRNLWDKPFRLSEFFDRIFKTDQNDDTKSFIELEPDDLE